MNQSNSTTEVIARLQKLGSQIDESSESLAIILAAGHGKRIKSETSKMLHEIWGVPTVVRVSNAAAEGLDTPNQIIVVGVKAIEVADAIGKNAHRSFVFQAKQNGTGDAVRTALEATPNGKYSGDVYIFPGDMGLLSSEAVQKFKTDFHANPCDMMVLTGVFAGDAKDNYYGRILRVPAVDINGNDAGGDQGKVIEIKENKDILALAPDETYKKSYSGRDFGFTKEDLIAIKEFNTGVYAFRGEKIGEYINQINTDNVQGELYLTDLISIFNQSGLTVRATEAIDNRTVLGFNVKSVLKEMHSYARENIYEQLKDIITIQDRDDFFIAEEVARQIIELDQKAAPLDISIGKGVHIGKDVQLSKAVRIKNYAFIDGPVVLGEGVQIHQNAHLSAYPDQCLKVGRNSEIYEGDIIKGNLEIGENCRIESSVNMTGSDEFPVRIGNKVTIKGTSYVFGSIIEDDLWIERSVLKYKRVERIVKRDGTIQAIRYVLPTPEGLDSVSEIKN